MKSFNKRQYENAISLCDKALSGSYCPDIHSLRGNCYLEIGEYNKAISDYNEAIKISPEPF